MSALFILNGGLALSIDFNQSHWFFPKIVLCILVLLSLLVVLQNRKAIVSGLQSFSHNDRQTPVLLRLGLVVALIAVYFWLMGFVGDWYPNMGLGFLAASIPFVWVFSLFYVPALTKKTAIAIALNALITPFLIWYVLGQLMNISLP